MECVRACVASTDDAHAMFLPAFVHRARLMSDIEGCAMSLRVARRVRLSLLTYCTPLLCVCPVGLAKILNSELTQILGNPLGPARAVYSL